MKRKTVTELEAERSMVDKLLVLHGLRRLGATSRHLPTKRRYRKLRKIVP